MKSLTLILVTLLAVCTTPAIAADPHAGHDMGAMDKPGAAEQMSEGTIKKVDKAAGKVTINHGPLAKLQMPPMTMVFRVKDPAWLDQMKPGDKIRFVADKVDGAITVVDYHPAN
ncbi:copper-binding protein [Niveibacterium sp. SC-1]|uniref:copper-binding protein n=1 Tax=Niveibacterium sp. SC-1 TaxID=3135646 RepID=UPI00311E40CA